MKLSLVEYPFPHLEGSLDSDFYEYVKSSWGDHGEHIGRLDLPLEDAHIISELNSIMWSSYKRFLPYFQSDYPKLDLQKVNTQFRYLYCENSEGKIRDWHIDTGEKLVVGLWYFKHPNEVDDGGHLMLMNPLNQQKVQFTYDTNKIIILPNLTTSWHSITPRNSSKYPRRFVNLLLEGDIKLHNYQRGTETEYRGRLVNYYK